MDQKPYGLNNWSNNGDSVWISREEYERLRSGNNSQVPQASLDAQVTIDLANIKARRARRRWQIILGVLLAGGLFISVSSGSYANLFIVGAIVIFGLVSLYDFHNSRKLVTEHGITETKQLKHNPYKILFTVLFCVVIVPPLLFIGFFVLMFSLGGGDMGS